MISSYIKKHISSIEDMLLNLHEMQVSELVDDIIKSNNAIYLTGIGKNGHVASKAASTFNSVGIKTYFINPVDAVHGDMAMINENDLIIAVSKSGNTEELVNFLQKCKRKTNRIWLIHSNKSNNAISLCKSDIFIPIEYEADHLNIVPTSSIATYVVFLQSIACKIAEDKGLTIEQFVYNHPGGSIGKTKLA